jgi:hypothetical protein
VTIGSAHKCHSPPVRRDMWMHTAAYARSEQIGKLIGRVRKACRRPRLLHHPGRFIAHKALNYRPTEWADVVDTGAAVARIPDHARLGGERTLAHDLDKSFSSRPSGRQAAA